MFIAEDVATTEEMNATCIQVRFGVSGGTGGSWVSGGI